MESLSPFTRRLAAVGLLVLLILLALQWIVLPLAGRIGEERSELAALRARHARLQAASTRVLPDSSTWPPGLTIKAATPKLAREQLAAMLKGGASMAGVQIDPAGPASPPYSEGHRVSVAFSATGPEGPLLAFASFVEHGAPAVRFEQWRLDADDKPGDPMRMTGIAVAAWEPAP